MDYDHRKKVMSKWFCPFCKKSLNGVTNTTGDITAVCRHCRIALVHHMVNRRRSVMDIQQLEFNDTRLSG